MDSLEANNIYSIRIARLLVILEGYLHRRISLHFDSSNISAIKQSAVPDDHRETRSRVR